MQRSPSWKFYLLSALTTTAVLAVLVWSSVSPESGLLRHAKQDGGGLMRSARETDTIAQRNQMSRMLNSVAHDLAKTECELKSLKSTKDRKDDGTTSRGGWCWDSKSSYKYTLDGGLADAMAKLMEGKSVASFGDGNGHYKSRMESSLGSYDSFDGAAYPDVLTSGPKVEFLDLAIPQYGLGVYDWVMAIEVAEHVPKKFEAAMISNFVRHAKEGLVISWAPPGQPGHSHVNGQKRDYVKLVVETEGFAFDEDATSALAKEANKDYLQKNVMVFKRVAALDEEQA